MHLSTVEQLRCAGVVAAVTISRSAFPNRLEHETVLERFKSLWTWGEERYDQSDDIALAKKNDVEHLLDNALRALEVGKDGDTTRAFVIGFGKSLGAALPALRKPRPSLLFYLD